MGTQLWGISELGWPMASDPVVKGWIPLPSPLLPEPLITFPKRRSQAEKGDKARSICSAWQSGLQCCLLSSIPSPKPLTFTPKSVFLHQQRKDAAPQKSAFIP